MSIMNCRRCRRIPCRKVLVIVYTVGVTVLLLNTYLRPLDLYTRTKIKFRIANMRPGQMAVDSVALPTGLQAALNNNPAINKSPDRGLYEIPAHNVSIMSAIGRNKSLNSGWDELVLNGWEGRTHVNDTYCCCIYYEDGNQKRVNVIRKKHWLQCKKVHYLATQFICPNPLSGNNKPRPLLTSLVTSLKKCKNISFSNDVSSEYVPITLPLRQRKQSIALCAKIAYGFVSSSRLMEWYEVQKAMGVSNIVTYAYNLTSQSESVLRRYEKEGLVDLYRFKYPHEDRLPRSVGDKTAQVFNDEQVVGFDCVERLSGYQFVGLVDHDEFIIPTPTAILTLKNLLNILLRRHPNASGFSFRTQLFITEWQNDSDTRSSDFSVSHFKHRTRPMWDRRKNIFLPDRVVPGSVWTHNFTDVPGYQKVEVSSSLAALKHYRNCRLEWRKQNTCFRRRMYRDTRLDSIISKIRTDAEEKKVRF